MAKKEEQGVAFLKNVDIQEFQNILQEMKTESIKSKFCDFQKVEKLHYLKFLFSTRVGSSLNVGVKIDITDSIFLWLVKKCLTEMNMHIILTRMRSKLIVMIATAILTTIIKY